MGSSIQLQHFCEFLIGILDFFIVASIFGMIVGLAGRFLKTEAPNLKIGRLTAPLWNGIFTISIATLALTVVIKYLIRFCIL